MANDEQQQCIFCHIASGRIPTKKVYEDDKVAAVLDINPATPGHILVVPKQHVSIMPQMSEEVIAHVGMIAKQLSHALIRALKVDGTSIFIANGVAAGQRAPHFLLHVIPRAQNDDIGLDLPHFKMDEKMMKEVFEKLGPAVAKQLGVEAPKLRAATEQKPKPVEKHEPKEHPKEPEEKEPEKQPEEPEEKEPPEEKEQPEDEEKPEPGSKLDEITEFLTGGK